MAQVIVNAAVQRLVAAAVEWVESIHDHPNLWAGEQEFQLIEAVRAVDPMVHCKWLDDPTYAGWTEAWHR